MNAIAPVHAALDAAPADTAWTAAAVDAPADAALHSASVQAARPVQAPEAPRAPDASLPVADLANGFALPADQLQPVTLIGLQVQPGDAWPMAAQAAEPRWPRRDTEEGEDPARRAPPEAAEPTDGAEDDGAGADADEQAAEAVTVLDGDEAVWQDALARAVNERLAAPQAPAALNAAAEQWARARCVVLVCPQAVPAGTATEAAWAFVLWPRRGARTRGPMARRFSFTGQRVEALLQWPAAVPPAWCSVRAVKQHHTSGRRLVALDAAGAPLGPVPCELQLGPVRAAAPRWRQAGVRVDAVRRFWTALGAQWSVLLLVCPQPLLAARAALLQEP